MERLPTTKKPRLICLGELECDDIKEYRYDFDIVQYCPLGDDVLSKKVLVSVEPMEVVPDIMDIRENVREWSRKPISGATETVAQMILDWFWENVMPRRIVVETRSTVEDNVKLEVRLERCRND